MYSLKVTKAFKIGFSAAIGYSSIRDFLVIGIGLDIFLLHKTKVGFIL